MSMRKMLLCSGAALLALFSSAALAVQPLEIKSVVVGTNDLGEMELWITGENLLNGSDLELWLGGFKLQVIGQTSTEIVAELSDIIGPGSYQLVVSTGGGTVRFDDFDGVTIGAAGPEGPPGPPGEPGTPPELCDLEVRILTALDTFEISPECLPDAPEIPTIYEASFDINTRIILINGIGTPNSTISVYLTSSCENILTLGGITFTGSLGGDGVIEINYVVPEDLTNFIIGFLTDRPLYVAATDSFGQSSECAEVLSGWIIK